MKAVVVRAFGGAEVMQIEQVPVPEPGPGQVRMKVQGIGVNFADVLLRAGRYWTRSLPAVPGIEAAGSVDALGPGVRDWRIGDRVCGWVHGAYAEYALAEAARLLPVPEELSMADAAAFPTAFGTAWHALATLGRLEPGQTALIHAAGSGVGAAAVQLARRLGALVVVSSTQDWKLERAVALGCDLAVNSSGPSWPSRVQETLGPQSVHVALEGVGRATFPGTLACMARNGRVVVYGAPSGRRSEIDLLQVIGRGLEVRGLLLLEEPNLASTLSLLADDLLPELARGRLSANLDRALPLEHVALAHQLIEQRAVFGKLVLQP